jgi:hypothetical protein
VARSIVEETTIFEIDGKRLSTAARGDVGEKKVPGRQRVILANSKLFPCEGSHLLHTRRFLKSFKTLGYSFAEAGDEFDLTSLSRFDIIYFSNHGVAGQTSLSINQERFLLQVAESMAAPIFWYWHKLENRIREIFRDRYILTGEQMLSEQVSPSHKDAKIVAVENRNFVPLQFASYLQRSQVGTLPRSQANLATYVGAPYKKHWNNALRRDPIRARVTYTPPFIPEWFRINEYLTSEFSLGWHSDTNILNGVVGERVFDSLALGALIVTDSRFAESHTNGLAKFVSSQHEAEAYILATVSNQRRYSEIQRLGFLWARDFGTYQTVAESFLRKLQTL